MFQQLVVQHGGLQRQADAPALQEQGLKAVVQRMVGQIGSVHQRARLFIKRRDQLAQQLHRVVEVVIELGVVLQLALLVAVKFLRQRRRHHGLLQTLLELQFPAWQIAIQRPANGRKLLKNTDSCGAASMPTIISSIISPSVIASSRSSVSRLSMVTGRAFAAVAV